MLYNILEIKRILSDNQTNIKRVPFFGGRIMNVGKTMKKRHRKSRKLVKRSYKGGYTYSSSRELDKSSSIISDSSGSNSKSKSKSKSKNKLRNKTRTKTRTTSSPNSEKTI